MISGIVLTHNNEKTIEQCLRSLTWCDEIVIIDDESSDNTLQIASKYQVNIYRRKMENDFASQRNFALKKANGEWVLFVDSDEIITKKLEKEIKDVLKTTTNKGFYFRRIDILFGTQLQFGETSSVSLLRLAKKSAGVWKRSVHEIWEVSGPTGMFIHPLLHYPHQTLTEFIRDINTYSTLHANEFYKNGNRVHGWEIVMYPVGKFLHNYVVRQGFRDGTPGAIMAIMMSMHSFLAKAKLYLLQHQQ